MYSALARGLHARLRQALIQQARAQMTQAMRQRIREGMRRKLLDMVDDLKDAARDANQEMGPEALRIARRLSSGRFSTKPLAAMGHPYARAHPHPPLPPYIINRQSGAFYAGWMKVGNKLVNVAPHSRYLLRGGTRYMIDRPILERIQAEVNQRQSSLVRQKIREALLKSAVRSIRR